MDLATVPGITQDEARRLREAGVADVAALAGLREIALTAERTGIPSDRLARLHASALDAHEGAGIVIQTFEPWQDVAQTLWRAAEDVQDEARARFGEVRGMIGGAWLRFQAESLCAVANAEKRLSETLGEARRHVRPRA